MRQTGFLSGFKKKTSQDAYSLAPIDGPVTESAMRDWLIRRIAHQVEVDPGQVDTAERFDEYGLDSIVAVTIAGDLEKVLQRSLSPALLFEHATIDELTGHLMRDQGQDPASRTP